MSCRNQPNYKRDRGSMTKTVRFQWYIVAAVGHAMIFWLFIKLLALVVEDAGTFSQSGVVLISGLTPWLFCVRNIHHARLWQFVFAGYLSVALDVVVAMSIVTVAMVGRFNTVMIVTSLAAVLPWVLVPWGTLMAIVSVVYGILLRRLAASDIAQRTVRSG